MTTKDQAIAPNKQLLEKFDQLTPVPQCTNGDKYQPAPEVVLWRTE